MRQADGLFPGRVSNEARPFYTCSQKRISFLRCFDPPDMLYCCSGGSPEQPLLPIWSGNKNSGLATPPLIRAPVMELVDMRDLGSRAFSVWVRVPSGAPKRETSAKSRCLSFWVSPPRGRLPIYSAKAPPPFGRLMCSC